MTEQVLVIPAELIKDLDFSKGIITDLKVVSSFIKEVLWSSDKLSFVDRGPAEKNPELKQLIPYMVLRKGDRVFCYKRTKKGGEKRLHDLRSVGVGGHINPIDGQACNGETFWNGLERELAEEVGLTNDYTQNILGLLYDNTNEVGLVHLGIITEILVGDKAELSFKDQALSEGDFEEAKTLKKYVDEFENWSKLVINNVL